MSEDGKENVQREFGIQPLEQLMGEFGLVNGDLVEASTEQLTHKQVQKARKGRRLTSNLQKKVKNALESAVKQRGENRSFDLPEVFNYRS